MKTITITFLFFFVFLTLEAQSQNGMATNSKGKNYPKALVNFIDYKNLVAEVEQHRKNRLIDLDTFLAMSQEENVYILDARSKERYQAKHLKGAKHINFSDFTQLRLNQEIPKDATVLIYCNNNFLGDQINFPSKIAGQDNTTNSNGNQKPIMLALNIPTYINLYGYGYRNIYELNELINNKDSRIQFVGTEVQKKIKLSKQAKITITNEVKDE